MATTTPTMTTDTDNTNTSTEQETETDAEIPSYLPDSCVPKVGRRRNGETHPDDRYQVAGAEMDRTKVGERRPAADPSVEFQWMEDPAEDVEGYVMFDTYTQGAWVSATDDSVEELVAWQ